MSPDVAGEHLRIAIVRSSSEHPLAVAQGMAKLASASSKAIEIEQNVAERHSGRRRYHFFGGLVAGSNGCSLPSLAITDGKRFLP